MRPKITEFFLNSAGSLLLMTGAAKLISASGSQKALLALEPVSQISFRNVFVIAGSLEMAIGLYCLFSHRLTLRTALVAWLSTLFLIYRYCVVVMGYHIPCSCLGTLTDALSISPHSADFAMKCILGYLLLGSYVILFRIWRHNGGKKLILPPENLAGPGL